MDMEGYFDEKFSLPMCWIDLLLLAEWQDKVFHIRGVKVVVKRGQIAISIENLSKRWKISKTTVQKRLQMFQRDERIIVKRSNIVNIITIINYERYQGYEGSMQNGMQNRLQAGMQNSTQKMAANDLFSNDCSDVPQNDDTQSGTQIGMQTDGKSGLPIKNIKNKEDNKESKEKSRKAPFHPPSLEEVKSYVQEKGYSVDAEQFVNFYESKGWMVGKNKMSNWHAAIATWQKREKERYGNFQQKSENRRGSLEVTATGEKDYSTSF